MKYGTPYKISVAGTCDTIAVRRWKYHTTYRFSVRRALHISHDGLLNISWYLHPTIAQMEAIIADWKAHKAD